MYCIQQHFYTIHLEYIVFAKAENIIAKQYYEVWLILHNLSTIFFKDTHQINQKIFVMFMSFENFIRF